MGVSSCNSGVTAEAANVEARENPSTHGGFRVREAAPP